MSSQASQKTAILSVYNKTGLLDLARGLAQNGVRILASGGTATLIRGAGMPVDDVSSVTNAPETLDESVETLHPAVHAGIPAWDLEPDEKDLAEQNIGKVNYVVCNLYPFKDTITKINVTVSEAVDKIDIAGVTLLRAAAKNHSRVTVLSDPADYATFLEEIKNGEVSEASRKLYAIKAFEHTADYDSAVAEFFRRRYAGDGQQQLGLRYGENPHQSPAQAFVKSGELPIKVLFGSPGYINLLDALNSWPLVKELKESLGLPAAASFKHVSPAGAAVGITLSAVEKTVCFVDDIEGLDESPLACAYARAREAERMSSFGDWIALSDTVDVTTAKIISREASDGVIAPSYAPEAFDLLKEKGGKYTILKIDPLYEPPTIETRQVYGVSLSQQRNDAKITARTFSRVLTPSTNYEIPPQALIDLTVATIALKYTQSSSACYAKNGQTIGLGAGQQSRIHRTRLAADKADKWWFRQHPKVLDIKWKRGTKRPDKSNAIDLYVSGLPLKLGDGMDEEVHENIFDEVPEPFTPKEIEDWRNQQAEVAISSDGSFPCVDNVFRAHKSGAKYMAAPGGSAADKAVHEAAGRCGIVFVELETRLFHH